MGRRFPVQAEQWSPVALDPPVIRINWPRVTLAGVLAAIVTMLLTLGFQAASERKAQAVSGSAPSATQVSSAPQADAPTLQLVAEAAAEGTDDRLPLGIFVRGPREVSSATAIEIVGLPSGWALSAGRPFGGNGWRISAAKLSDAVILPPRGFSGAIDLAVELRLADDTLVERRSVRRVGIGPALATMPSQPIAAVHSTAIESPSASGSSAENVVSGRFARNIPESDSEQIMLLLRVAEGLLGAGDLSAARTVLRRAALAGNARAALLLGETYDKGSRRQFVCSPAADRATARNWYEVAREFGSTDARQRLDRLAHCEPGGDLPSRP